MAHLVPSIPTTRFLISRGHIEQSEGSILPFKALENRFQKGEGVVRTFGVDSRGKIEKKSRKKQKSGEKMSSLRKSPSLPPNRNLIAQFFPMESTIESPLPFLQDIMEEPEGFDHMFQDLDGVDTMGVETPPFFNNFHEPKDQDFRWQNIKQLDAMAPYTSTKATCSSYDEWIKIGQVRKDSIIVGGSWLWTNLVLRFVLVQRLPYTRANLSQYTSLGRTRYEDGKVYLSVDVYMKTIRSWDTLLYKYTLNLSTMYTRFLVCLYWNLRNQLTEAGYNEWGCNSMIPSKLLEIRGFCTLMESIHKSQEAKIPFDTMAFLEECNGVWNSGVCLSRGTFANPYDILMDILDEFAWTSEEERLTTTRKSVDMLLCVSWSDILFSWSALDVCFAVLHCIKPVDSKGRDMFFQAYDKQDMAKVRALGYEVGHLYENNRRLIGFPFMKDSNMW